MQTYYFTYGVGDCTGQAFQYGGWTEVEAESREQAVELYRLHHPLTKDGFLPCCGVAYTKEQMEKPFRFRNDCMLTEGNNGKFCRERITVNGVEKP